MPGDNQDMEQATMTTTEWFTRYGTKHEGRVFDADPIKGTARTAHYETKCSRCGGAGQSEKWRFTGLVCFDCGGSGRSGRVTADKLYSAERLAKLDAAQAKRDEARRVKAQAAQEVRNAERRAKWLEFRNAHPALVEALAAQADPEREQAGDAFLVDMYAKLEEWGSLTDGQVEAAQKSLDRLTARAAAKAASQFVGEIGKRLVFTLTVEHIVVLPCGCTGTRHYCFGVCRIFLCRDDKGNRVVYKGSSHIADKGETFRVKATVEAHDDYKGENQTKIARPKVLGVRDPEDGKFYIWDPKVSGLVEVK